MEEKKKTSKTAEIAGVSAEKAAGGVTVQNPTENDANAVDSTKAESAATKDELTAAYIKLSEDYRRQSEELADARRKVAELSVRAEGLEGEINRLNASPDYEAVLSDERFIDDYAMKCEPLRTRIIADYLVKLNGSGGVSVLSGAVGNTPLTPVAKPRSLSEAKRLAEILIKGQ